MSYFFRCNFLVHGTKIVLILNSSITGYFFRHNFWHMGLKLFSRSKRKSAVPFEETLDYVHSSIRKPLVYSLGATHGQVADICDAYISLWSSTPSEVRAREIYNTLVHIAKSTKKSYPLDWLVTEILFEAFAASSGDRRYAAQRELEHDCYRPKEKALSLYNERLTRVL
jgi:hypothetical protein